MLTIDRENTVLIALKACLSEDVYMGRTGSMTAGIFTIVTEQISDLLNLIHEYDSINNIVYKYVANYAATCTGIQGEIGCYTLKQIFKYKNYNNSTHHELAATYLPLIAGRNNSVSSFISYDYNNLKNVFKCIEENLNNPLMLLEDSYEEEDYYYIKGSYYDY